MDLAEWAANAAKSIDQISDQLKQGNHISNARSRIVKITDRIGQGKDEAKMLAENTEELKKRANLNRQMEQLGKVLMG